MIKRKTSRYYLAYGSNLSLEQMAHRCPDAKVVGDTILHNYRLMFRGNSGNAHATIERVSGYYVPVLVWEITCADETALDLYEGFPRYYYKEYVNLQIGKDISSALIYIMTSSRRLGSPSAQYYDVIKSGYEKFNFDIEVLNTALQESNPRTFEVH